ncbi:MAG: S8 family serine peptidase [Halobacteriales archaeon]
MPSDRYTRRDVLRRAGAATVGVGAAGRTDRRAPLVHVGYASRTARRTAFRIADGTVREFAFDAATLRLTRPNAERLRRRDDVRYVEPVRPVYRLESDEAAVLDDGMRRVEADRVHEQSVTGAGAHVAVVDSGVARTHDALSPNLGAGKAVVSAGIFHFFTPWADDHGHGTHCAGIAGAAPPQPGVASAPTLHAVKVLDGEGEGTTDDAAAGIQHVAERGWDVANLSFGGPRSSVLADACAYARRRGVLPVAAAGKPGEAYPAKEPECFAVGATDGAGSIAGFSPTDGSVDLVAPGLGVRSTLPDGYGTRTGTSMACSFVAGAAALLASRGYSPDGIEARLRRTATDLDADEDAQGAGRLDVAAALGVDEGP